jgi:hypothetical protein
LDSEDISRIAGTYHAWRGDADAGDYEDVPGFCRSVGIDAISEQRFVLTPGRYIAGDHDDEEPQDPVERFDQLTTDLFSASSRVAALTETFKQSISHVEFLEPNGAADVEWSMKPLSSLARFVNGRAFTKNASGTGRMVIRIAELTGGPGPSTVYSDIEVSDDYLAHYGDLLFAWSGSLVVQRWHYDDAIINQHIFKVIPNSDVPLWFVHAHLLRLLPEFRRIAAEKATTMGHIQRHHLDVAVAVPDPSYLEQVSSICEPIWNWNLELASETLRLEAAHDAVLQLLAGGELCAFPSSGSSQ